MEQKKNVYIKLLSVWEDIMKLIAGKHLEHHKLYPWSLIKLFPMEKKNSRSRAGKST